MAKKRQVFHTCGAEVNVYRKGKKHRVFVCSRCGIIATNPIPLLGALAAAAAPTLIEKTAGYFSKDKAQKAPDQHIIHETRDRFTTEERVAMALR